MRMQHARAVYSSARRKRLIVLFLPLLVFSIGCVVSGEKINAERKESLHYINKMSATVGKWIQTSRVSSE